MSPKLFMRLAVCNARASSTLHYANRNNPICVSPTCMDQRKTFEPDRHSKLPIQVYVIITSLKRGRHSTHTIVAHHCQTLKFVLNV